MERPRTDDDTRQFWDREVLEPLHVSWMENARVRRYIAEGLSPASFGWPMNWFASWLNGRRFRRALSIGCGTGAFERDLIERNLCDAVDAFDGSSVSIRIAEERSAAAGFADRISYRVADFNRPDWQGGSWDLIAFHQSAHHVSRLERVYGAILRALAPGGLLYLDEYVGPSRFAWDDARLTAGHRAFYERVPPAARRFAELPLPVQPDDPSEAVRSSEIVPQLLHGFEIVERRDYGGNLLSVLYQAIDWRVAGEALLEELIEADRAAAAAEGSYYSIVVARPKRGAPRWKALARYAIAPKLRRVWWEVRKLRSRGRDVPF